MRTIGFYSFKGGVGRTNLLLNIAYYLATHKQLNVGMMDMDLEAPGLTVLECLKPPLLVDNPDKNYPSQGLWDFLEAATLAMKGNKKGKGLQIPEITDLFYETALAHDHQGSIFLAPAYAYWHSQAEHKHGADMLGRLISTYENGRIVGQDIFRYVKKRIEETTFIARKRRSAKDRKLDYLLVDLRTGLTELADTAAGSLFNELIIVSGLNTQNVNGTMQAIDVFSKKAAKTGAGNIRVIPVFSPLPNAEIVKTRERLIYAYKLLKEKADHLKSMASPVSLVLPNFDENIHKVPEFRRIHYCDYLALEDDVLLKNYPETQTAREIMDIAGYLSDDPDTISKEIRENIERVIPVEKKDETNPPTQKSDIWKWISDIWTELPDWRWPLSFQRKPFPESRILDYFPDDLSFEYRNRLLTGLASSLSLSSDKKMKMLGQFKTMENSQFDELLKTFANEQDQYIHSDENKTPQICLKTLSTMADWVKLMRSLGADLGIEDMIMHDLNMARKILPLMPDWAFYLLIWNITDSPDQKKMVANRTFKDEKTPIEISIIYLREMGVVKSKDSLKMLTEWIHRIQNEDAHESNLYYNVANLITKWGLVDEAEKLYRKACRMKNGMVLFPWYGLGNLLSEYTDRYDEAEMAYRKAIEIDPKFPFSWSGLGNTLAEFKDRYNEAEMAFRKAIEIYPKDAAPWNNLGVLLSKHTNRYDEAEIAYKRAIEIDPTEASYWNNLGNILTKNTNRYDEAEMVYRKAIELDPKGAAPWNGLGCLLSEYLGRYEEAEEAYRKAIELDPEYFFAYLNYFSMQKFFYNENIDEQIVKEIRTMLKIVSDNHQAKSYSWPLVVLAVIYGDNSILQSFLKLNSHKILTGEGEIKGWLCARARGFNDFFLQLPDIHPILETTSEFENIINYTAILWEYLKPKDKKIFRKFIKNEIKAISHSPKHRKLNTKIVTRFLSHMGMENLLHA